MDEEDKGEGGGGGRATQTMRQPVIEKKKTWSELKQACIKLENLVDELDIT